eukprot:CAMPEP_0202694462 /NCGR_PEP_ID=MMETSP1385-20130828/8321_1 /ASSEMBLY_ACC=CAM_ASM_000861 /TAXON_ID=933848 /ORGANISM="Elphidium margaritaceum" /LENGTH=160 /DNA_ID=CAMNT_0049350315 /DNA_START=413 /DNA_END=895 /DNA_ORIENTATION=-
MGNIKKTIVLNDVSPDYTLKELSAMICNAERIDASRTIIVYPFALRSEFDSLRECGVCCSASLEVSFKFKHDIDSFNYASSIGGVMIIFVKTLKGKQIWIACNQNDMPATIKTLVYECEGIPVRCQQFMFNGKSMDDGLTLAQHNIYHLNTINLILRLHG